MEPTPGTSPRTATRRGARLSREADGYCETPRADRRPILGTGPADRLARLARLKAAIADAGWGEGEANRYALRVCGQIAIELLTRAEAEEFIAVLAAVARERGAAR